jgi:hypothetical protein
MSRGQSIINPIVFEVGGANEDALAEWRCFKTKREIPAEFQRLTKSDWVKTALR